MRNFPGFWRKRGLLAAALFPISVIYGALVRSRRALYRCGALQAVRVGVPVIVVGNVLVGGTGKTPLVLALAQWLKASGLHPGIVSRGHGRRDRGSADVRAGSDPARAGDEPVLLALRSSLPVWVGRDRVAACRALLASHPDCDLIISDDGLQHYRLARDLEILVEDERGAGNGLLLPAGPLREASDRRVDLCVVNTGNRTRDAIPGPRAGKEDIGRTVFGMRLDPVGVYRLDQPSMIEEPSTLAGLRLHAVAGIGHPQRFFETLQSLGLHAVPHAFPDHHDFRAGDLEFADCDAVLMTEKDAVKCRGFCRNDLYALRVQASLDPAFFEQVLLRLRRSQ